MRQEALAVDMSYFLPSCLLHQLRNNLEELYRAGVVGEVDPYQLFPISTFLLIFNLRLQNPKIVVD